jgi:hypothetical protein
MFSGIRILAFLVGIYYIYRSYNLTKEKKGEVRQFLTGTVIGLLFIVVSIYPDFVLIFSQILGMSYRGYMMFAGSILLAYLIIMYLFEKISELNTQISKLNEEVALTRYMVESRIGVSEKENES